MFDSDRDSVVQIALLFTTNLVHSQMQSTISIRVGVFVRPCVCMCSSLLSGLLVYIRLACLLHWLSVTLEFYSGWTRYPRSLFVTFSSFFHFLVVACLFISTSEHSFFFLSMPLILSLSFLSVPHSISTVNKHHLWESLPSIHSLWLTNLQTLIKTETHTYCTNPRPTCGKKLCSATVD